MAGEIPEIDVSSLKTRGEIQNAVIGGLTDRLGNYSPIGWLEEIEQSDAKDDLREMSKLLSGRDVISRVEENNKQEGLVAEDFSNDRVFEIARREAKLCLKIYRGVILKYFEDKEIDTKGIDPLIKLFNLIKKTTTDLGIEDKVVNNRILGCVEKVEGVFRDLKGFAEEGKIIPLIWPRMRKRPDFDFSQPTKTFSLLDLEKTKGETEQ